LYGVPPVEVQAATCPFASTATAPTVPMPRRTLSAPSRSALARSSWKRASALGVMKRVFGYSGMPHSRAKASAPGPARSTWGVSSQTRRASTMGFLAVFTHATAPARSVVPSMQLASISTSPALVRQLPVPALKVGSSSSAMQAACAASSADPPASSTRSPASAAREAPAR
jgi:hypothetical protein